MACRKCGSSWTTIYGADRASCPECCKLQRCKERAAGRYKDPEQRKTCAVCESSFVAVGSSQIAKREYCSQKCRIKARNQRHAKRAKSGDVKQSVQSSKCNDAGIKRCANCMQQIKSRNAKKYCSKACFFEARAAGVQKWDRTSIHKAAKNRPNNVCQSPEAYATRAGKRARNAFLRSVRAMWRSISHSNARHPVEVGASKFTSFVRRLPKPVVCKLCGEQCFKPASWRLPHCSLECARKDCEDAVCNCCNQPMKIHFIGGNVEKRKANPVCNRCVLKRHKKLCGDFKRRCRKFCVSYNPKVTRPAVFERDGYCCHICKKKTLRKYVVQDGRAHPRSPTVDHHPYPLSVGIRGHEWDNVRCACLRCNVRKGAAWSGQVPLFR